MVITTLNLLVAFIFATFNIGFPRIEPRKSASVLGPIDAQQIEVEAVTALEPPIENGPFLRSPKSGRRKRILEVGFAYIITTSKRVRAVARHKLVV